MAGNGVLNGAGSEPTPSTSETELHLCLSDSLRTRGAQGGSEQKAGRALGVPGLPRNAHMRLRAKVLSAPGAASLL